MRAKPTREITLGSCRCVWIRNWATVSERACNAFGGLDGRGDMIRNLQSSEMIEERTAMQRDRSSGTFTLRAPVGDDERERTPEKLFRERRRTEVSLVLGRS